MISQFNQDTQIDYLSFACILIKKDIINTLGGLDESLTFYHEDCEYGLRARTFGHNITYTISSKIIHLGGTSSSAASFFALENDVKGLLYIFKKYYPGKTFKMLRIALLTAFSWRIILWNFGLYRNMKKIGLYSGANTASNRSVAKEALHKYREIRHYIRNYR